jgi:hypothetical protein
MITVQYSLPALIVITWPAEIIALIFIFSGVLVGGNDFRLLRLKEARLPAVKGGGYQVEKDRYTLVSASFQTRDNSLSRADTEICGMHIVIFHRLNHYQGTEASVPMG